MDYGKTLEDFNEELDRLLGNKLLNGDTVHLNDPEIQKIFKDNGLVPFKTDIQVFKTQR